MGSWSRILSIITLVVSLTSRVTTHEHDNTPNPIARIDDNSGDSVSEDHREATSQSRDPSDPGIAQDSDTTAQNSSQPGQPSTNEQNTTTQHLHVNDSTSFVNGINGWDFSGFWGKFDLDKLEESLRPVPVDTGAKDQGVFICQVKNVV